MKKISLIAIVLFAVSLLAIYCTDYDFNNPYDSRNLSSGGGGNDEIAYYCPTACELEFGASRPSGCFTSRPNCLASQLVDPSDVVTGTMQDPRDGKTYRTVTIGTLTWLAENLNFETAIGSWCYDDDSDNCDIYGRLYDWNAAVSACAGLDDGWRLSSDIDWGALVNAVGGETNAGTKLKSQEGWLPNSRIPDGTDDYGFSALPGGQHLDNNFYSLGGTGLWWSSTESSASFASIWMMSMEGEWVGSSGDMKFVGCSARCVRN